MRAHDTLGFSKTLFNDSVTWTTSNSLIASLGDDPPTSFSQEIQAVAVGTAFLTAQWDAFADIVQITVAPESVRIESFLATSFVSWYDGNYDRAPGIALSTLADEHTASWGNFGMKDLSSEPRQAFNNDPSYTYSYVADWPWDHMYDALLCLRDAILGLGVAAEVSGGGPSPIVVRPLTSPASMPTPCARTEPSSRLSRPGRSGCSSTRPS